MCGALLSVGLVEGDCPRCLLLFFVMGMCSQYIQRSCVWRSGSILAQSIRVSSDRLDIHIHTQTVLIFPDIFVHHTGCIP